MSDDISGLAGAIVNLIAVEPVVSHHVAISALCLVLTGLVEQAPGDHSEKKKEVEKMIADLLDRDDVK